MMNDELGMMNVISRLFGASCVIGRLLFVPQNSFFMEHKAPFARLKGVSGYNTTGSEGMDEQYFVETVQARRHAMWRVAYSILHGEADAEDAVSAAVEAVWRQLPRLRSPEALPVYLMKSVVNAAKSECRKRRYAIAVETLPERAAEAPGEDIVGYVSHLTEKYRLPILLKYGENLPEKDIAAILGIPRGTVSSRINRALALLRKELEKEESGHA